MDLFSSKARATLFALESEARDLAETINRMPGWRADQPLWGVFDNGTGWISVVAWHKRTKMGYLCRSLGEWQSYLAKDDAYFLARVMEAEQRTW